jgi:hypothetical protein
MTPPLAPAMKAWLHRIGSSLALDAPDPHGDVPPLVQPRASQPIAPALLARHHPQPKARPATQALYQRCLLHYRQRLQHGAAQDDAGLAAACFVLANLAAVRGLQPGEDDLLRVERQLRARIAPVWLQAPLADRQSACEQFAVIGVLVGESAAQARGQGAAAQAAVQQAARGYLAQGFGLDADRLHLGALGLVLEMAAA